VGIGIAYASVDVPAPNDFARSQATIVTWSDGETELGRFNAENREIISIEDVPEHVRHAVLAAEDRSFYDNQGISVTGIARAAWNNLRGDSLQGASTITQQYVKNYYLTQEQTYTRKIREVLLAVKIDGQLDKDQILEDYLNTIYFGRGAYGVQTASRAYFGKPASELSVEEGAVLAAIIRAPGRYDPAADEANADRLQDRFRYVLDGMVERGWTDAATASAAQLPEVVPPVTENKLGGTNGYLLDQVRRELLARGFTDTEIDTAGLRVTTTFDRQAQESAVRAVAEEFPTEAAEGLHVGLAAVRPGDGGLVAIYGGADFVEQPRNNATQAAIQPGSTFKAFTLAAALEEGVSLRSRFAGNSPLEDPALGRPVNNLGDTSYGEYVDMLEATRKSINTAFVDLTMEIGPDKVLDAAVRAGIPENAPGLNADARITLGTSSVTPVQLADAYATLAAQGEQADWYTVAEVRDPSGAVRYSAEPTPERALDPEVTADVTYALTEVVENGTGEAAQALGRPSAGKTGTAEDLTAWYAGYTPQLAAAVGFWKGDGTESLDGTAGMDTFTGGAYPARLWTAFMAGALEGTEVLDFPEPANLGERVNPEPTRTAAPPRTSEPAPPPAPEPTPEPEPTEVPTPELPPLPSPPTEPTPTGWPTGFPSPGDGGGGGGGNGGGGNGGGRPGGDEEEEPLWSDLLGSG
jgi:membrane peptidoglycan carboxypeptidase